MNNDNSGSSNSNKYPILSNMGILNPNQIDRYSVQTSGDFDILRVVYKREKGSLLPSSKKFKFKRIIRVREEDSDTFKTAKQISEISPALSDVMLELDKLVKDHYSHDEQLAIITDEIQRLEEETHTRITYIKSLVEKLK